VLGCTHYPLMATAFQEALGPGVKVYSQANLVAESLADYLIRRPEFRGSGTQSKFLTTGDPAMTHRIAILGASGYTGAELVRLIATHPGHAHCGAVGGPQGRADHGRGVPLPAASGPAASCRRSTRSTFPGWTCASARCPMPPRRR
jgi:hypothetical protein